MKRKNRKFSFWSKYYDAPDLPWPMAVRSVGYNRYKAGDRKPMLKHPWHHWMDEESGRILPTLTVVHVLRGGGLFRSQESGELEIPENSLLFVLPGVRHFYKWNPETGWDDEWLEVEASAISPLLGKFGIDPAHPIVRLGNKSRVALAFRKIFDLARHDAPCGCLAVSAYEILFAMLGDVSSEVRYAEPVDEMKSKLCMPESDAKSLRELSSMSGLSASRMRTLFREKVGMPPKRFQIKVRLERASRLLSATSKSVTEIAFECGFKTVAAFSNCFAREYGVSPRKYRLRQ